MKALVSMLAVVFTAFPLLAQSPPVSHDPRELGVVTLTELSVRDGTLAFRTASNGCTDAASFKVRVRREADAVPGVPAYRLAIERVRIDDCKMLVLDGVEVELDLARAAGISGTCTLSFDNPVTARQGAAASRADQAELRRALLGAMVRSIGMEIEGYTARLKAAEGEVGASKDNADKFRRRIEALRTEQAKYSRMRPEDYPLPGGAEADDGSILEQAAGWGPVLPARMRVVPATIESPCADGTLLAGTGASRSGPFYHLAGITGGDYRVLRTGRSYSLTVYVVYRREYFGTIGDYYVYVAEVR